MTNHTQKQVGLTLVEVLVVLVLVGLLSTMLMQGFGYFLGKYHAVRRFQYATSLEIKQQHWFTQTLKGMIPYARSERTFKGAASSFSGISMQALSVEPGLPVKVSWSIEVSEGSELSSLYYQEEGLQAWKIRDGLDENLGFFYADSSNEWHRSWPPEENSREKIPHMIMLATAQDDLFWLVYLPLFSRPLVDFNREF